jgi:hypothetical protein
MGGTPATVCRPKRKVVTCMLSHPSEKNKRDRELIRAQVEKETRRQFDAASDIAFELACMKDADRAAVKEMERRFRTARYKQHLDDCGCDIADECKDCVKAQKFLDEREGVAE